MPRAGLRALILCTQFSVSDEVQRDLILVSELKIFLRILQLFEEVWGAGRRDFESHRLINAFLAAVLRASLPGPGSTPQEHAGTPLLRDRCNLV